MVVPPVEVVEKVTWLVVALWQTVWLVGWSTCAEGLTVMVNEVVGPSHVTELCSKWGVTVMVATTGEVPLLVAVNELMSPLPEAASPIDGVLLTQVQVVVPPVFWVLKVTWVVLAVLQIT